MRTILFLVLIALVACQSSNKKGLDKTDQLLTGDEINELDKADIDKIVHFIFASPSEIFDNLSESGIEYKDDILHDAQVHDHFVTSKSQALNLGIYTADLAYLNFFNNQKSREYFKAIENLSQKVNISPRSYELIKKVLNDKYLDTDSITNLANEIFYTVIESLENQRRSKIVGLITYGGYIESLYLTTYYFELLEELGMASLQMTTYKHVIANLLDFYNYFRLNEKMETEYKNLVALNKLFDKIEIEEDDGFALVQDDDTDEESTDDKVNIPEGFLDELGKKVNEIRAGLIVYENI